MDGIILLNKEKGITSRDLVNKISKELGIKKVGHAGTLDPLATGLMIIGVGKGTKILDLLTLDTKEYIATVKMGIETDTLDITGNIVAKNENFIINREKILDALASFTKTYMQTVPKYSAVKINGKRLYNYARENKEIELPKRKITIYNLELIDLNLDKREFTFKTLVSKGTYIRSLIKDLGDYLNILMTMKDLIRIKSGKFVLDQVSNNKLISIKDALDYKIIKILNEAELKKVRNGNNIELNNVDDNRVILVDGDGKELAIYEKGEKSNYIAFKVF